MKAISSSKKFFLNILAILIFATSLVSCSSQEELVTPETSYSNSKVDLTNTVLKRAAAFPIGAAVDPKLLSQDQKYRSIAASEFSSLTTENALKWGQVHPKANSYNFAGADSIVALAQQNGMRVHGHTLISFPTGPLPTWVTTFKGDSAAWENMFKNHIQTVVKRYKGKITSWDVVNELFEENGQMRTTDQTGKLENVWLKHLGKDYAARAFQYAHEADPNALLFYNDNKYESSPARLKAILAMVQDFKQRNIPIHGLGLQTHITINTSDAGIVDAIKQVTATGLLIHISELDVQMNPSQKTSIDSTSNLKQQANKFYLVANSYKKLVPATQQYGITFWNVTDKDSWYRTYYKNQESPLLFNDQYQRKAAYTSFYQGLNN